MATKVYVGPYVNGPEVSAPTDRGLGSLTWHRFREFVRYFLFYLIPQKNTQEHQITFGLQIASLFSIAVTVLVLANRPASIAAGFLWAIVGGLVFLELTVAVALARRECRRGSKERPQDLLGLAFRLTNFGEHDVRCHSCSKSAADEAEKSSYFKLEAVTADKLQTGDVLLVEEGQYIRADGNIVDGTAIVDEAAVTGQSTKVLREAEGLCEVMRDTLVVKGRILVQVTPPRGHPLDWIITPSASTNRASRFERLNVQISTNN